MPSKHTLLIVFFALFCWNQGIAQFSSNVVSWQVDLNKTSAYEGEISFKASIEDGWYLYALKNRVDSPIRLVFSFEADESYKTNGAVQQPEPEVKYEPLFGFDVYYFQQEVVFTQAVTLRSISGSILGKVEYMACNALQCLPPQEIDFEIPF